MGGKRKSNGERIKIIDDSNNDLYVLEQKKIINEIIDTDISIKEKNKSQAELIKKILANEIIICSGKAGTGKTFISLALALGLLKSSKNNFTKIYLVKSVTTLKGEEIGYLKGDINEKIEPFIWSFTLNVEKLIPSTKISNLINSDFIRPFPLAYARGVSIDNAIIIVDECQNISIENMRTLMTRLGEDSKLILLGDTKQIDLKNKKQSSLSHLINMFQNVEKIGVVEMDSKDKNVRNPLIDIIEQKFEQLNYE